MSADRITTAAFQQVTCPRCKAKPGEGCVTAGNAPVVGIHAARFEFARDELFDLTQGRNGPYYKRKPAA